MLKPNIPPNESQRLKELEAYQLIGIAEDDDFDFITSMAAQISDSKISLISFVLEEKQWFLSHYGLMSREASREYSFCGHAINKPDEVLIVEDARKDERFWDNPFTTGEPYAIFYAGVPLVTPNGQALGTLCVVDDRPKNLNSNQIQQLKQLAKQTLNLLQLRRSQLELNKTNEELKKNIELFKITQTANKIGNWEFDIDTGKTVWSEMIYSIYEVALDFDLTITKGIEFFHPDYKTLITDSVEKCVSESKAFDVECKLVTANCIHKWIRAKGRRVNNTIIGSLQDITSIKDSELKFKGIFNSTFSFIGFLNTDGVLLEANDTAVSTAGITQEDVIGKLFWDCYWWQISEKTKQQLKVNFQKAVAGEAIAYEVAIWSANKTPLSILFSLKPVFDESGQVIYIIPEGRPIQEIVETKKRLQSVIEGTNVGTWEWNVQTGTTFFNERWAGIVGYTLEELAPISIETWMKLTNPEDLKESERRLKACFDRKTEFYECDARMRHKQGHWVWVYDRGKVFEWSEDGQPIMMYGTHQDISERKNREEALRISEEAFRGNFENAAIGMALLNEQGRWLKVNRKLCEILGYIEEELYQLTFQDLTHPDDLTANLMYREELINGLRSQYQMEKRYFRKDGEVVYTILAVSMVRNSEGNVLYFISQVIDITEQKQNQLNLEYQQNLFSALYKLSPIGIALNDYETGNFLDVNNKLIEPTGYKREEYLKLSYQQITKKENKPLKTVVRELMKNQENFESFQKEFIRKDGSTYPVDIRGVIMKDTRGKKFIWSFIRDISKEKEAELKLRVAIKELQAILDASQQVSIIATDTSGLITQFNAGAERMLGYKSEELSGLLTPLSIHLAEEVEKEGLRLSTKYDKKITDFDVFVIEAQMGTPITKEWTYVRKNGTTFPVLLSVNAIVDEGQIIGYLGVAADITGQKVAEENLRVANKELETFSYTVAHDLRAPLRAMHGYAQMLNKNYGEKLDQEAKRIITNIQQNASKMGRLIDSLLSFSKLGRKELLLAKINMEQLTKEVLLELNKSSSQKPDIHINNLPVVMGDYSLLCQVMMNLISNAIKYSSKKENPVIEIFSEFKNEEIIFSVKDNGSGFDMKYAGKLFNVFQRLHAEDEFEGNGIGLATVSRIIAKHGGRIWAEGKVDVGATFYFTLPNKEENSEFSN